MQLVTNHVIKKMKLKTIGWVQQAKANACPKTRCKNYAFLPLSSHNSSKQLKFTEFSPALMSLGFAKEDLCFWGYVAAYGPWLAHGTDPTAGSLCAVPLVHCPSTLPTTWCPERGKRGTPQPAEASCSGCVENKGTQITLEAALKKLRFQTPIDLLVNAKPRRYKNVPESRIKDLWQTIPVN